MVLYQCSRDRLSPVLRRISSWWSLICFGEYKASSPVTPHGIIVIQGCPVFTDHERESCVWDNPSHLDIGPVFTADNAIDTPMHLPLPPPLPSPTLASRCATGRPWAGIMEADDRQVTTVFTVQPSFHHRHTGNLVSWRVTIVAERAVTPHLVVRRRW